MSWQDSDEHKQAMASLARGRVENEAIAQAFARETEEFRKSATATAPEALSGNRSDRRKRQAQLRRKERDFEEHEAAMRQRRKRQTRKRRARK